MIAAGIDLGGTKIELQLFDNEWQLASRKRVDTPQDYDALVGALADIVRWADSEAGTSIPVGIGAAGLLNPETELALTANLCATGKPLKLDVEKAVGRAITYVNDCRALALSEAVFGVGKDAETVLALILGTGVGGGVSVNGSILSGPTQTGGEFGHMASPAHLLQKYNLPAVQCGCGRVGCVETYISGRGMTRLAKAIMGEDLKPPQIVERKATDAKAMQVWEIWSALTAELLCNLTLAIDPDVIILGGGLSKIEGLTDILQSQAQKAQLGDFGIPPIRLAQGGDASGARGAAYAAYQEQSNG